MQYFPELYKNEYVFDVGTICRTSATCLSHVEPTKLKRDLADQSSICGRLSEDILSVNNPSRYKLFYMYVTVIKKNNLITHFYGLNLACLCFSLFDVLCF